MGPNSKIECDVMDLVCKYLNLGKWLLTRHAIERMLLRGITSPEIEYAMQFGFHEKKRDQYSEKGTRYALRGKCVDGKELRIVVSFREQMMIVTVIDLDASPDFET